MSIDKSVAHNIARVLLSGAYLDEIRVGGIQVALRFISTSLVEGMSLNVDLVFACAAEIVSSESRGADAADFHEKRSTFLFDLYRLMGRCVTDVELDRCGCLELSTDFENKKIVLDFDPQDGPSDDWIWKISVERMISFMGQRIESLACTVEGGAAFHVQ
jgi:hypothetical protein